MNPYPWAADGVPIIAAYGMGLQGWDASYEFASGQGAFDAKLGGRWNVMQPVEIGQYPVFARMVHRGDVAEADVVSVRNVHMDSIAEGRLGFVEEVTSLQTADFNAIRGDIPLGALAVGRVAVAFTEEFRKTEPFDLSAHIRDGRVRSVTKQLAWTPADTLLESPSSRQWYDPQGYVTIETDGTVGLVGFAPKGTYALGPVTIEADNFFAVIGMTSRVPDAGIAKADSLLISAVARSLNTGAEYFPSVNMALRKNGDAPILLEPVRAGIRLERRGTPTVHVLDHDGRRTGKTVPVREGRFQIDTGRDRTFYYEVAYGN